MRGTRIAAFGAAFAVVTATALSAGAGSGTSRATGGGQILVPDEGGPGDTIAFTAQNRPGETADFATGQVQYVDRETAGQTVLHGVVSCLVVDDNMAFISGTWRQNGEFFQIFAEDNGEGANAAESDMIVVTDMADDVGCDFDEPDDNDQLELARGNVRVYEVGP
jgi:hypothetical protein